MSRKKSGIIVRIKQSANVSAEKGMVYNKDARVEGKLQVYVIDENFKKTGDKYLIKTENLSTVGFFD